MSTTVLDANQVIKKVYDEPTESLKVNATVVAQDITLIVDIDEADDSIQIYGNDGSVNRAIKTDSDGNLQVDVLSSALPAGAATEAKQDVGNASLASIDNDIDVALSTRASEATLSTLNGKVNNDYGVASGAVRTASQIGNTAGAADFNAGPTTAQTLRTTSNITRNGAELSYNSGTVDANTLRISQATDVPVTVIQPTHDNLNLNANIQVSDVDVSNSNPVPISDAGGSITVDAIDLDIRNLSNAQDNVLIYGQDNTVINHPIRTDANGELQIDVLSSALPAGAATEAKQDIGNASLASIDSDIDVALSTRASEATLSTINGKINNNYGAATGAIRTASQIGNTTGAADFNAGTTSAQTLRTTSNITRNGTELSYNDGTSDANTIRTSANIQRDGNDLDYNIGTPSANTIRTAAILSNSTGQIDYNAGTTGAQTPRVTANITRNGTELSYNDGTSDANTVRTSANIQRDGNDLSYNTGTVDANTLRVTQATDIPITVIQPTHDNLNLNANIQVNNTDVSDTNSVPTRGSRGTLTDFSGTAGSVSAQILASNASRKYLLIQNSSNNNMWINFTTAATSASPSIRIAGGETFVMEGNFISTEAINAIRQSSDVSFTGKEG